LIPLKNWSKDPQRFNVTWKVEGDADPGLFIRGASACDVGGNSVK
jgi:hypothetical protein